MYEWRYHVMRVGFGGGIIIGALVGAAVSLMAEENFNVNRSIRYEPCRKKHFQVHRTFYIITYPNGIKDTTL